MAVVLSLLDPPQAKALAETLDAGAVDRVIAAYEDMRSVPKPVLLQIIAGFVAELRSKSPKVRGGRRGAAALAEAILDPAADANDEGEQETSLGSVAPGADPEAIWAYLEQMEPVLLSRMISNERPAVIAAILARVPEDKGGQIVTNLPETKAAAVVTQMAQGAPVSQMTLDAITESLRRRASSAGSGDHAEEDNDALPRLTAILNRCPMSRQEAVLAPLRETAEEHAMAVEQGLIRFPNLGNLMPRNVAPMLFREIEETVLHTAVRFGAENATETVDFLYANISQRLAEQIRERIDANPMPSEEDGESAQAEVISTLLEWEKEGRFAFSV